jgi:hypothetical protein
MRLQTERVYAASLQLKQIDSDDMNFDAALSVFLLEARINSFRICRSGFN